MSTGGHPGPGDSGPQAPEPSAAAPKAGLLRSTAVFSAMTLLSRIAGFVRDMVQATQFGTGGAMSAFIVAYRIPNFLRRVFAEGSMSMAFIPVLNEIREKGDRAALKDFIDHMAGWFEAERKAGRTC